MKERKGYEWIDTGNDSGFWKRVKEKGKHPHKLSFYCPECTRITGTIDDKYLLKYGVCSVCYVDYIEGREAPIIDLSKYKMKKFIP